MNPSGQPHEHSREYKIRELIFLPLYSPICCLSTRVIPNISCRRESKLNCYSWGTTWGTLRPKQALAISSVSIECECLHFQIPKRRIWGGRDWDAWFSPPRCLPAVWGCEGGAQVVMETSGWWKAQDRWRHQMMLPQERGHGFCKWQGHRIKVVQAHWCSDDASGYPGDKTWTELSCRV